MSNLDASGEAEQTGDGPNAEGPVWQELAPRAVALTPRSAAGLDGAPAADPLQVSRFIPTRGRRMVGAWCFVDYYGPVDVSTTSAMRVPPHPHCGLQTVTWLLAGEVRHCDSEGHDQLIRPGELNLMTAGHGICHAEVSAEGGPAVLHGLQLWVVLTEQHRDRAPSFEHWSELPTWQAPGVRATILLGSFDGVTSPASSYSPLVGLDAALQSGASVGLPLLPEWEYAVLVTEGAVRVDGVTMAAGAMVYLGTGRDSIELVTDDGARLLLLGGEPFTEQIVMWWNFIARDHGEIVAARDAWQAGRRFGAVPMSAAEVGQRLPAPPMPAVTLRARGRR